MKRMVGIVILSALFGAGLVTPATAQADNGVIQLAQGRYISLDEAVERVRRQVDGEVIGAKTRYEKTRDGDRPVHYIKVYDRGRVRTFRIDASTGRRL